MRLQGLLLAAGLVLLAGCGFLDSEESPDDYDVHGIDISTWQGDIDWNAVRADGVAFAFIKATEGGDHLDPRFQQNWEAARAAGVPRGAYHFYYFCRPVADQIAWFIENVPVDPSALPPVLDMEWNAHSPSCNRRPPRAEVLADMNAFLAAIEAHYGRRPIIYTSVDFHRDVLVDAFTDYPVWVRSVADPPYRRYTRRQWTFWQYTAEGRVRGISGDVDRNVYWGSAREWTRFVRGETPR
ncbi:MAG: glycoside hydrolase family 25 protein [Hyphomicrobiaceae bacterium]|nr:glycoside hydrolase family 25 protein [Hyphomicrobiaceae bacterium]